jgi:hypothetical protein
MSKLLREADEAKRFAAGERRINIADLARDPMRPGRTKQSVFFFPAIVSSGVVRNVSTRRTALSTSQLVALGETSLGCPSCGAPSVPHKDDFVV